MSAVHTAHEAVTEARGARSSEGPQAVWHSLRLSCSIRVPVRVSVFSGYCRRGIRKRKFHSNDGLARRPIGCPLAQVEPRFPTVT